MKTRKKFAQFELPAAPGTGARVFDGSPPGKAHSICSRCGGRSEVGVSLCPSCQGELSLAGADYAHKERDRKAVVRKRKKELGW